MVIDSSCTSTGDLFKEESSLIDERGSKIVEMNQSLVRNSPAFEVIELLEDSASKLDDVEESPDRTGNDEPIIAPEAISSVVEAKGKKRKVRHKRKSAHHGEDTNNVATPSEVGKDRGMSHGSPTGPWSITDLEKKMSTIKVEPNNRPATAQNPPKQQLIEFPFHQGLRTQPLIETCD